MNHTIQNRKILALVATAVAATAITPAVHAADAVAATGIAADAAITVDTQVKTNRILDVNASTSASTTIHASATGTVMREKDKDTDRETPNEHATDTARTHATGSVDTETNGETTAESHRSAVAAFVHSLLSVADRDGGIGTEVRTVAQAQNASASTTVTAMAEVEERGSIRTLLFGSDYKNLGVIRSEMATTANNIKQLRNLLDRTTDASTRAELDVQLKALETEEAHVSAYVTTHEDQFSLFGWFTKLFVK